MAGRLCFSLVHGEQRPHGSRAPLRKSVGNAGTVGIAGAFLPKAPKISVRRIVHIPEKHSFTGRFATTDASVPTDTGTYASNGTIF